jgi:hypothetical protein
MRWLAVADRRRGSFQQPPTDWWRMRLLRLLQLHGLTVSRVVDALTKDNGSEDAGDDGAPVWTTAGVAVT